MDSLSSQQPTWGQVLLGWFVAGQLLFLTLANIVFLIPAPTPSADEPNQTNSRPVLELAATTRYLIQFWENATLQRQSWGLFPQIPNRSTFPAVRLVWKNKSQPGQDSSRTIRSIFEPDDPSHYFLPNFWDDRLYNYDAWLSLIYDAGLHWDEQTVLQEPKEYQRFRAGRARDWWKPMRAYMQWRWHNVRAESDARAEPDEMVLFFRVYTTLPVETASGHELGPAERNLARWLPQARVGADELPLQVYDPHRRIFVPVKALP